MIGFMDIKVGLGKKKRKTDLTTAQISAIMRVSFDSLYVYVRNFPEYFSDGAKKHTVGRLWTQEDLEMVQTIRCLYHEKTGTENIRSLLQSGWRLQNTQIWTRELISLLLDQTLTAQEETRLATREVITLQELLAERKRNNKELQEMWIQLQDLQHEWEVMQKAWRLRTVITKAVKKKYHGKLPELYIPEVED